MLTPRVVMHRTIKIQVPGLSSFGLPSNEPIGFIHTPSQTGMNVDDSQENGVGEAQGSPQRPVIHDLLRTKIYSSFGDASYENKILYHKHLAVFNTLYLRNDYYLVLREISKPIFAFFKWVINLF